MKVVIAIDKFKGSLTSAEAADTIEQAVLSLYPACDVAKIPVSDGGDGLIAALVPSLGGKYQRVQVADPLMRQIRASYGILPDNTAVIELAAASGLALLSPDEYNPMITSTYGTGQLIADALQRGITDFILGIGGSVTNDAGTGILDALGYRFLNKLGNKVRPCGGTLAAIAFIDSSSCNPLLDKAHFRVACDVDNPFCGKQGAAYVFAPQKGADEMMVKELDKGMEHFASIIEDKTGKYIRNIPGAGAAGGVGGALLAFLHAKLLPGIDLVLDALHFDRQIKGTDLIITGEGKIDRQTLHGKVVKGVAERAKRQRIPAIAFTGKLEYNSALKQLGLTGIYPINPPDMPVEKAMQPDRAKGNLYKTAREALAQYSP
jgi:glycerate kinase